MHLHSGRVYQYVIDVAHSKGLKDRLESDVDICFECSWCLCPPKRHDFVLELPKLGGKHGFVLVTLHILDEVIGIVKVQLCEHSSSMQSVKHLPDQWERIFVLHPGSFENLVVDAQ